MTAEDEEHRAELERLAFGRTATPAEQQRAEEALRQLHETQATAEVAAVDIRVADSATVRRGGNSGAILNRRTEAAADAAADADAAAAASSNFGADDEAAPIDDPAADHTADTLYRRYSALPRWMFPVLAVGLVAIGALGGVAMGGTKAADPPAVPPATTSTHLPLARQADAGKAGDVRAAERWFAGEQTPADALPYPFEGRGYGAINSTTSRLAMKVPGESPWNLWVARTADGGFCLYVAFPREGTAESTCTTSDGFVAAGLSMLSIPGSLVHWDGGEIVVTRSK